MSSLRIEAERDRDYIVGIRRYLHSHPERSREEYGTASRIEAELDIVGIPHRRVGETGVLGIIKGKAEGAGKTVLLRADTDALPVNDEKTVSYRSENPGTAHVCGHDAHTAALIGAARLLAAHACEFAGEVRLMFQQAEEIGYGARMFIADGITDGVDRVIGAHTASDIPCGKFGVRVGANNASVDYLKVSFKGKGAHISTPEKGNDALSAAAETVLAPRKAIAAAGVPEGEKILLGIGHLTAGTTYNVLAEDALAEGTLRAFSRESRENVKRAFSELASEISGRYGVSAVTEWTDFTSPLINDAGVCRELSALITSLFGDGAVVTDREISLGGDDFAELLLRAPGAYVYVGTSDISRPDTCRPNHNGHFDIDERALLYTTLILSGYTLGYLKGDI